MGQLSLEFIMKIWKWIKKKWKILAGVIIGIFTLLGIMMRNRYQKRMLDNANKAHELENKANDKARKDLVDGLTNIAEEKDKTLDNIDKETTEKNRELENEKKIFIDEAAKSDDLARKIADLIGAEYIDANKE
jgi:hypothetical protein